MFDFRSKIVWFSSLLFRFYAWVMVFKATTYVVMMNLYFDFTAQHGINISLAKAIDNGSELWLYYLLISYASLLAMLYVERKYRPTLRQLAYILLLVGVILSHLSFNAGVREYENKVMYCKHISQFANYMEERFFPDRNKYRFNR